MRDPKALAEASELAGLWDVRYAEDADAERLLIVYEQYRALDYRMACGERKTPWTHEAVLKWVFKHEHPMVVEKGGVLVGSVGVREPVADEPHISIQSCAIDKALPGSGQLYALRSLVLTFILFARVRGIGHVQAILTPEDPLAPWVAQIVEPEAEGLSPTGTAERLRYYDTTAHAEQAVRMLATP